MLDVGRQQPPLPSLNDLKRNLSDPIGYFLGKRFESVVYPDQEGEYYGFPPGKDYVFAGVDQFQLTSRGFTPLSSFARGGLAEAWTAGVYPLNEAELEHYPVSLDEMTPYYDLVAQRIGITGETDDLSRFMPVHDHLMTPLDLDEHSKRCCGHTCGRNTGSTSDTAVLWDGHGSRHSVLTRTDGRATDTSDDACGVARENPSIHRW